MSKVYLTVKGCVWKMRVHQFPDGTRQINGNCCAKVCPHKCAGYIVMPAGLWSVSLAQIVEKCFSQCKRLESLATETAKQHGQISLTSLAKSEAS